MSDEIVIGSIYDRTLQAIADLGDAADRKSISNGVDCNANVLLITLEGLQRNGMIAPDGDIYRLSDEMEREYRPRSPVPSAASATRGFIGTPEPDKPNGHSSGGTAMRTTSDKKICETCKESKARNTTNFDRAPRAADGFTKDCKTCRGTDPARLTPPPPPTPPSMRRITEGVELQVHVPPAASAAPVASAPADTDGSFVINATGHIECRTLGSGDELQAVVTQFGHKHRYSLQQVKELVRWCTGIIERERDTP